MDKSTHEVRRLRWKNIIAQCQNRPEGMSAKQWLADHSVSEKSYYYWLRKLRKDTYEQMQAAELPSVLDSGHITFTELPIPTKNIFDEPTAIHSPAAVIKTANATIVLSNEISDRILDRILLEVSHA